MEESKMKQTGLTEVIQVFNLMLVLKYCDTNRVIRDFR